MNNENNQNVKQQQQEFQQSPIQQDQPQEQPTQQSQQQPQQQYWQPPNFYQPPFNQQQFQQNPQFYQQNPQQMPPQFNPMYGQQPMNPYYEKPKKTSFILGLISFICGCLSSLITLIRLSNNDRGSDFSAAFSRALNEIFYNNSCIFMITGVVMAIISLIFLNKNNQENPKKAKIFAIIGLCANGACLLLALFLTIDLKNSTYIY